MKTQIHNRSYPTKKKTNKQTRKQINGQSRLETSFNRKNQERDEVNLFPTYRNQV